MITYNTDIPREKLQEIYESAKGKSIALSLLVSELMTLSAEQSEDITIVRQRFDRIELRVSDNEEDIDTQRIFAITSDVMTLAEDITNREYVIRSRYTIIKRLEHEINKLISKRDNDHEYCVGDYWAIRDNDYATQGDLDKVNEYSGTDLRKLPYHFIGMTFSINRAESPDKIYEVYMTPEGALQVVALP